MARPMKIFYSWQSDTDPRLNRFMILNALESAAESVSADPTIEVEPIIDRDTKDELGAVPIRETILKKIDSCDVFVADITATNKNDEGELSPNPNVLFELGYAY